MKGVMAVIFRVAQYVTDRRKTAKAALVFSSRITYYEYTSKMSKGYLAIVDRLAKNSNSRCQLATQFLAI